MEQTQTTQTFANVAIYRGGMMGISRTDCKALTVATGQQYAQYSDAVRVEYTELRKRKPAGFWLTYKPWMRVVALADAISPDAALIPIPTDTPGIASVTRSRYSSCDPRWETDFDDLLAARGVPVLLAVGAGDREGEFLDRMKKITPDVPAGEVA